MPRSRLMGKYPDRCLHRFDAFKDKENFAAGCTDDETVSVSSGRRTRKTATCPDTHTGAITVYRDYIAKTGDPDGHRRHRQPLQVPKSVLSAVLGETADPTGSTWPAPRRKTGVSIPAPQQPEDKPSASTTCAVSDMEQSTTCSASDCDAGTVRMGTISL